MKEVVEMSDAMVNKTIGNINSIEISIRVDTNMKLNMSCLEIKKETTDT